MIVEAGILALCLYGLMKEDDIIKLGAIISMMTFPAVMIFAKAGAADLVLVVLALEAVPFAFALLLIKLVGKRYYRGVLK